MFVDDIKNQNEYFLDKLVFLNYGMLLRNTDAQTLQEGLRTWLFANFQGDKTFIFRHFKVTECPID